MTKQNVGLKISVVWLLAYTGVDVFSKFSHQTSACMCSTSLMSYDHTFAYTLWKNMLIEKILREMKTFVIILVVFKSIMVIEHENPDLHDCGWSEVQISKIKRLF
jgi:hypothetical protein